MERGGGGGGRRWKKGERKTVEKRDETEKGEKKRDETEGLRTRER